MKNIGYYDRTTGPPLPELSPRIVNTSGYIAFLFHFVVKGRACSLIIFTHYLNALQASVRGMKCTTQTTVLFLLNRGRDHKQAQYHPEECASYFSRHLGHPCGNQNSASVRYSVVSLEMLYCLVLYHRTVTLGMRS